MSQETRVDPALKRFLYLALSMNGTNKNIQPENVRSIWELNH